MWVYAGMFFAAGMWDHFIFWDSVLHPGRVTNSTWTLGVILLFAIDV